MNKPRDTHKDSKKAPLKTPKEKRSEKLQKKEASHSPEFIAKSMRK